MLIPFSSEVVSLGVTLDSKLTWKPQVDQVTKKVNKALYSLRFIRACTTETLCTRLVESFVQPHLDYCTVVYLDATNEQRTRLDRSHHTLLAPGLAPFGLSQIIFYSPITVQNQTYARAHLSG